LISFFKINQNQSQYDAQKWGKDLFTRTRQLGKHNKRKDVEFQITTVNEG
jgi:plasmid replication initiation protein